MNKGEVDICVGMVKENKWGRDVSRYLSNKRREGNKCV